MRIRSLYIILVFILVFSGCSRGTEEIPAETPVKSETVGDRFLKSNLKIQSSVVDTSTSPETTYIFELYVDSDGNGQGLIGLGEKVLDVVISDDVLYILLDNNVVVGITDITGRLVFTGLDLAGESDLSLMGFTVDSKSVPIEYSARQGSLVVNSNYAQSVNTFEATSISATKMLDFKSAITYILDYMSSEEVSVDPEETKVPVVDFYIQSEYGVEIDGTVYSVGDTCNPATYFNGQTPEGILGSYEYKQDTRVDFQHISYLSNSGRTVFTVTGNYVQAIQTTASFKFLGVSSGLDEKELKSLLGYKLSKSEQESFKPLVPGLSVTNVKSSVYYCTLGALNVEFRCEGGVLSSVYVEQRLDYKG